MYFGGDLELLPPPVLFQLFNLAPLTGMLKLEKGIREARFYFREGRLAYAVGQADQKRIGQILVEGGIITLAQLNEALAIWESEGKGRRIGEILVELGYLDPMAITEALREQMRQTVYEVLTWNAGKFSFLQGRLPACEEVFLDADMGGLLLEGLRRFDEAEAKECVFAT